MGDPVSILVSPIVKTVIGNATSLIKEKYHLLQQVGGDVEKLGSVLTAIQAVLEDAENKQMESSQLRDWLGKLEDAVYDADDILETFETEACLWQKKQQVRKFQPPFSASKADYKLKAARKIKDLLVRLYEIAKEKEEFHLSVGTTCATSESDNRNTSFFVNKSDVVGREDDKNKIIDQLLSKEFDVEGNISVIPIIGMGGLGKTTLAQFIYNDDRVKSHFDFRMWVCVTDNFDFESILKEMIEYHTEMNYDLNSLSETQLRFRLLEILSGKCFFLVLDDVWTHSYDDWEKIHNLLKQGGKGCRVLVTSRSTRVSDVMGTQPPYLLDCLPEDQCWSLFEKIAFTERNLAGSLRRDLEDIGKEIVRKCNGLPLAVKAMGGLLRGNIDVTKWRRILQHEIWEAEEQQSTNAGRPIVLPALKLSYDHLPSHLKQCFAYCYIFPKAYVFYKIELVKLWKAASLIQPRGGDTIDGIGSDYFDELLTRSFFQFSEVDSKKANNYKMHDLIHELAQSVSKPSCYQVKDNKPGGCHHISERCRHISVLCKDAEQPVLEVIGKSKKLRTFLSPVESLKSFGQTLERLFHTLKYIRVLDLSSSTMLELPESVKELKLLRYLDLSKTEIRMLPNSICSLYHLQTLKLLGCLWLFELPKDLGNLFNLQHLELDEMFWHKLHTLPPRMGRLCTLQNLHAFRVRPESGYGIDELKDMLFLTGKLHISNLENAVNAGEAKLKDKERLVKVVFEWSNGDGGLQDEAADEKMLEDLQPHSNVEELQIVHYRGTRLPSWLRDGQVKNLVTISLNHCTKCKVLSLGQLPKLGGLCIKGMLDLEEWPEAQYPSLHRLKISNCPKLRELPHMFPNLRVLKIKKCDTLKALPLTPSLMFLILVNNPVLEDWKEAILRVVFVNDEGQHVQRQQPSFINLLELRIINCPMLPALQYLAPQKLEISRCPLLSTLPIPEFARRLQHLALDECHDGALVRAIPNTSSLYSLVISKISSLTSLPKLPHLPGLKALYIHGCKDLVSLSEEEASFQGLNSLKLLSIQDCPKLVTLPDEGLPAALECLSIASCDSLKSLGPAQTLKNITTLKDLYIHNCPALEALPEEELPTSLQHLQIKKCLPLAKQCQKDTGPDWPKIMHIPDLELESIEASSAPHPKIKASLPWFHPFASSKGQTSKGKMVP